MTALAALAQAIRESRGVSHKRDIAAVVDGLGLSGRDAVPVGDDAAVIPDPAGGFLLLAMEGFVADFVTADPWFAGYCAVMVNVSDIAAMGGVPMAVVDALWASDAATAAPMLAGMREAASKYGVPVVGGHTNLKAGSGQLAAAILGRAENPLTSFAAQPGDTLLVATDLRGAFRDPFPWWDASTRADGTQLRGDVAILSGLAADGLVSAAKDISMAGVIGTMMMLAEASGTGFHVDLDRLPRPGGIALERWLAAFPSFGFILATRSELAPAVAARFHARGIACAEVGAMTSDSTGTIAMDGETERVWDFARPFTGCTAKMPIMEMRDA